MIVDRIKLRMAEELRKQNASELLTYAEELLLDIAEEHHAFGAVRGAGSVELLRYSAPGCPASDPVLGWQRVIQVYTGSSRYRVYTYDGCNRAAVDDKEKLEHAIVESVVAYCVERNIKF